MLLLSGKVFCFLNYKLVKKKVKNKIELFKNDKSSKSNKTILGEVG